MDATLLRFATSQDNLILRGQAIEAGYTDHEIMQLRESGEWHRVRRGAYVVGAIWRAFDEMGKHRTLTRAVVLQLTVPAVPSHVSAAVMLGLPMWTVDLSTVHVTRSDVKSPRREAGVHHHIGRLSETDLLEVRGMTVTSAARTGVDMARTVAFESAVVTADAALARPEVRSGDLLATLDQMRDWAGRAAGPGRLPLRGVLDDRRVRRAREVRSTAT